MPGDQFDLFPDVTWWVGVVENRHDPLRANRFQVRIYALHSPDQNILPTEDLMWAMALLPTTSAGVSGVGTTPSKIMQGSTVVGVFIDGKRAQQPVILGTLASAPVWTPEDRKRMVQETPLAELPNALNGEIEQDFDALPEGSLRDMLLKRFEFEGPHIVIKPNLEYENTIDATLPRINGASETKMRVFRHCAAIFLSNINYLCVSPSGRVGKYQFTPNFLIDKGFLSSDAIFDPSSWVDPEVPNLTEFLHSRTLQEDLFVDWLDELGADSFPDAMVGLLVEDGLSNWSDDEIYVDSEGRDTADAFMKGLLAEHLAEEYDGE